MLQKRYPFSSCDWLLETSTTNPELFLFYLVSNNLGCIFHLLQKLIKSSQCSDDAPLEAVSRFADLFEGLSLAPVVCHLDELFLDAVHVVFLRLNRNFTSSMATLHWLKIWNICLA